jgi:hypothetical protein
MLRSVIAPAAESGAADSAWAGPSASGQWLELPNRGAGWRVVGADHADSADKIRQRRYCRFSGPAPDSASRTSRSISAGVSRESNLTPDESSIEVGPHTQHVARRGSWREWEIRRRSRCPAPAPGRALSGIAHETKISTKDSARLMSRAAITPSTSPGDAVTRETACRECVPRVATRAPLSSWRWLSTSCMDSQSDRS